jgi:hypothetical protein
MRTTPCRGRGCSANIVWAQFEDTGRWHPFDLADDGNWALTLDDGGHAWAALYREAKPVGDGAVRAISHYASCADAAAFRQGGKA